MMMIQINTDKAIPWDQRNAEHFSAIISEELDRFSENITRVEVHLSDVNGAKKGANDIRCLMEVRIEGRQPIAGTDLAVTVEQAVSGAIDKVKASLRSILDHK